MNYFNSISLIFMITKYLFVHGFVLTPNPQNNADLIKHYLPGVDLDVALGPLYISKNISISGFQQLCPDSFGTFKLNKSCNWNVACNHNYLMIYRELKDSINSHPCKSLDSEPSLSTILEFVSLHKPPNISPDDDIVKESVVEGNQRNDESNAISSSSGGNHASKISSPYSSTVLRDSFSFVTTELQKSHGNGSHNSRLGFHQEQKFPICASFSTGIFPYYGNDFCQHFIECISGKGFLRKCPSGSVFNDTSLHCVSDVNSLGCTRIADNQNIIPANTQMNVKLNGILKVSDKFGSGSQMATNRNINESLLSTEKRKKRNVIVQTRRMCTASEYYIQPSDIFCNKFEICSNGRLVVETCGLGAMFNPLSSVCDFPYNVDCESRIVDFSTYDCRQEHKYRASHPEKCDQFIECDRGNLHIKTCPPSTAYNYEEEECDHIYKVKCKKIISLEHDTDANYHPTARHTRRASQSTDNTLNLDCRLKITPNYIAPHPIFCNKFVECEEGRIFIKDCGPGTVYNREIGQCDWAYNTRLPDPDNCGRYQQCESGRYAVKQCLGNTVYNHESKRCVFNTRNVDCRRFSQIEQTLS